MKYGISSRIHLVVLISVIFGIFFTGCGSEPIPTYSYNQPEQVEDGFETGKVGKVDSDGGDYGFAGANVAF